MNPSNTTVEITPDGRLTVNTTGGITISALDGNITLHGVGLCLGSDKHPFFKSSLVGAALLGRGPARLRQNEAMADALASIRNRMEEAAKTHIETGAPLSLDTSGCDVHQHVGSAGKETLSGDPETVPNAGAAPPWTSRYPAATSMSYSRSVGSFEDRSTGEIRRFTGAVGLELVTAQGDGVSVTGESLERLRQVLGCSDDEQGHQHRLASAANREVPRQDFFGYVRKPVVAPAPAVKCPESEPLGDSIPESHRAGIEAIHGPHKWAKDPRMQEFGCDPTATPAAKAITPIAPGVKWVTFRIDIKDKEGQHLKSAQVTCTLGSDAVTVERVQVWLGGKTWQIGGVPRLLSTDILAQVLPLVFTPPHSPSATGGVPV